MRVNLRVDTNVNRLRNKVGDFIKGSSEVEGELSKDFADELVDGIKESINRKFTKAPTGNMEDSVESYQRKQGVYEVDASAYNSNTGVNYAAWHEYAESGHYAYYETYGSENTELIAWAKRMGIYEDTWRVYVEPTSFMDDGFNTATRKYNRKIRSNRDALSQEMREKFGN